MDKHPDWDEMWQQFTLDSEESSAEMVARRLQQRAQQYARPVRTAELAPQDAQMLLVFRLGDERYCIDVMVVRGVRTMGQMVRVPGTPAFYRGVVNVRGQVLTVLDLRIFFDISITDNAAGPDELVVVESAGLHLGLLAHTVEGVVSLSAAEFAPVDNMRYALGVTADQLVWLDMQRLMSDEQLIVGGKDDV